MRFCLPCGITRRSRLDAEEITAEQIDGAGSPSMAERLAIGTTIHREVFVTLHFGIVLLPERRSPFVQHAAPVGLDFREDIVVLTELAECGEFVEAHVGCGDGGHFGVLHHIL